MAVFCWIAGTRKVNYSDFNETGDDGMAATSAGPCENHLCLAADESAQQHHQARSSS